MYTLGIETSCDETACAVLKGKNQILSNIISSSIRRHRPFGGVVPEIASRHCLEVIDIVFKKALGEARIKTSQIDLIAVTQGPGLIGSIFVGVSFAKALAFSLKVPLVPVNHIEAHLESNFIKAKKPNAFIGLIVSGGHTSLVKFQRGSYHLLGETVDDAIGEAYDKVAKILGLGYPGGPVIDRLANGGNPKAFSFTTPRQDGAYDFSFSGIKTAVYHLHEREKNKFRSPKFLRDFCASFQETVVRWVVDKLFLAAEEERINSVVVGGGVSANSRLRRLLTDTAYNRGIRLFLPPQELTTDNAAMIARLGFSLFQKGIRSDLQFAADPSLKIAGRLEKGSGKQNGRVYGFSRRTS